MRRGAALCVLAAGLVLALAGCGGDEKPALTILAAASLTEVLPNIDEDARYSFAGSDTLATQIREGAPADVYVAANARYPAELADEGLVDDIRVIAHNRLVIVVPADNPAGIATVADLAAPDVRLVVASETVPAGEYTRAALETLGALAVLDNVVSNEDDVKAVVGKVALGEADAGIAYATDVNPVGDRVKILPIPDNAQPAIDYLAGVITSTSNRGAASAFLDRIASDDGRELLAGAGFSVP